MTKRKGVRKDVVSEDHSAVFGEFQRITAGKSDAAKAKLLGVDARSIWRWKKAKPLTLQPSVLARMEAYNAEHRGTAPAAVGKPAVVVALAEMRAKIDELEARLVPHPIPVDAFNKIR